MEEPTGKAPAAPAGRAVSEDDDSSAPAAMGKQSNDGGYGQMPALTRALREVIGLVVIVVFFLTNPFRRPPAARNKAGPAGPAK